MTKIDSQWVKVAGPVLMQSVLVGIALTAINWAGIETDIDRNNMVGDATAGLAAGCLTYLVLLVLARSRLKVAAAIRRDARVARDALAGFSIGAIIVVATTAAVGEELLFRVFLQQWISTFASDWIGVFVGALLFALAHASSITYSMLTFVVGVAIGAVYAWHGSIVLIICWHFSYDLVALLVLIRSPRLLRLTSGDESPQDSTQSK